MFQSKTDLEKMVGKDERVLWIGKPDKLCYFLEGIFNPLLPFAIVWLMFDSIFIIAGFETARLVPAVGIGMTVFMLLHLMPVWIYLTGVLFIYRRYKHTQYIITEKGVYISGGMFSYSCDMKPFTELARVNIHRGIFDQIIGVGDVILTSNNSADFVTGRNGRYLVGMKIEDIKDYQHVFELVKKLQEDIYTDTMYPNDLRPADNHGYKTEYKGRGLDV